MTALNNLDFTLTSLVAVEAGRDALNGIDAPTMWVLVSGIFYEVADLYDTRLGYHAILLDGRKSVGNIRTKFDLLRISPRCIGAAAHGAAARV